MKKWLALLVTGLYLLGAAVAWAQPTLPPPPTTSIYVQDYAGVLSNETKAKINTIGGQLATKTKAQVVVVTVKTLEGEALEDYSLGLLRQWGVGDKTLNNGVVMLVAVDDRKSRIEVGYGLEGALPDAKTGTIQDEYMLPSFKKGDYDQGILNGYLALIGSVAKEYNVEIKGDIKPIPAKDKSVTNAFPLWAKVLIAVALLLFLGVDWFFLGGFFTSFIISMLLSGGRRGGGSGGGGFGGGSGGGGGSNRNW